MAKREIVLPAPPPLPTCRLCKKELEVGASVCPQCGKYQQFWGSLTDPTILLSFLSTILSFLLFGATLWQASEASQANTSAQQALVKVVDSERAITQARKDIMAISESAIEITEILPRSTGYGAGLSRKDTERLRIQGEFLKRKLHEYKIQ